MVRRLGKWGQAAPLLDRVERLAPWVFFILIVWLCWQIASVFWMILNPPASPFARSVPLGSGAPSTPNITGFNYFAENNASPQTAQADLPMRLEGIFMAQPDSLSAAVINVNNASARYRVGQQIDNTGYQLASVNWNVVTLQRNDGSTQQLKFDQPSLIGGGNPPAGHPGAQAGVVNGMAGGVVNGMVNGSPLRTPDPRFGGAAGRQNALNDAVRQMRDNPTGYVAQMGLQSSGDGRGYEVSGSAPPNLLSQFGLKVGDKILSVNGQPVGNPTNDAQLMQQMQQGHNAQVQIQRGSQTLTVQQSF